VVREGTHLIGTILPTPRGPPREPGVLDLERDRGTRNLLQDFGQRDLAKDLGLRDVADDLGQRERELLGASPEVVAPEIRSISGGVLFLNRYRSRLPR